MGQGKSKSSIYHELFPVDVDEDTTIEIDIDSELNSRIVEEYERGRLDFNVSAEELDEILKMAEDYVLVSYDPDFYFGSDRIGEEIEQEYPLRNRVLIYDEDLRYAVYNAVIDVLKVQAAFGQAKDTDVPLVRYLYFGNHIEGWDSGTLGWSKDVLSFSDEDNTVDITIESSKGMLLQKKYVEDLMTGNINTSDTDAQRFLIERNSYANGWFSVTGAYQKTTVTHELGHAVYRGLNLSSSDRKMIKNWYESTRGNPVSGYSQYNHDEAFAECFNLFINGGKSNSTMYKEFVNNIAPSLGISSMFNCLNVTY